ncbi:hypothetical protein Pfo_016850 [Paulownia fortunei]|nr:hypothetical protein Pfo_016850 [Paulownia fortunei]
MAFTHTRHGSSYNLAGNPAIPQKIPIGLLGSSSPIFLFTKFHDKMVRTLQTLNFPLLLKCQISFILITPYPHYSSRPSKKEHLKNAFCLLLSFTIYDHGF